MMCARLIANLEALLQFGLAHRVRRGDTIATIHLAILPRSAQFECWRASLEDAGFDPTWLQNYGKESHAHASPTR